MGVLDDYITPFLVMILQPACVDDIKLTILEGDRGKKSLIILPILWE